MKTLKILFIAIIAFTAFITNGQLKAQPLGASINFNLFYNELSPYGQWRTVPRYGQVWSYNEPGFRPYATNGQWEYSDMGWTWVSGYNWGWGPFHYGRWELDSFYGWIWIPGYDYAPAWVTWSQADDYYGWAPLGFGIDINISIGRIPANRWVYASRQNIMRPRIDHYFVPYSRNHYYTRRQRPVRNIYTNNNVRFMSGPSRREVERFTHTTIQPRNTYPGRSGNPIGRNDVWPEPTPITTAPVPLNKQEQERVKNNIESSRQRLEDRTVIQPQKQPAPQPVPQQQQRVNSNIESSRQRLENRTVIQPQSQPAPQPVPQQQQRVNSNIESSRQRLENRTVIQPQSQPAPRPVPQQQQRVNSNIESSRQRLENRTVIQPQRQPASRPVERASQSRPAIRATPNVRKER